MSNVKQAPTIPLALVANAMAITHREPRPIDVYAQALGHVVADLMILQDAAAKQNEEDGIDGDAMIVALWRICERARGACSIAAELQDKPSDAKKAG